MQVFLTALLLGALVVPNVAYARGEVRLRLVPSSQSRLSPLLTQTLYRELEEAVKSEGLILASPNPAELTACEMPDCLALLHGTGATHALYIDATFSNESYSFHLEVWDVEAKRSLGSDSRECAICASQDLVDDIALRAQGLFKRTLQKNRTELVIPKPSTSPPIPEVIQQSGWQQALPYVGIGLIAVGLGLATAGGYYYKEDGQPVTSDKTIMRDTKSSGVALILSGAGALACGVGFLTWHSVTLSTTVAIGPRPVMMATLAWPGIALP